MLILKFHLLHDFQFWDGSSLICEAFFFTYSSLLKFPFTKMTDTIFSQYERIQWVLPALFKRVIVKPIVSYFCSIYIPIKIKDYIYDQK